MTGEKLIQGAVDYFFNLFPSMKMSKIDTFIISKTTTPGLYIVELWSDGEQYICHVSKD